MRVFIGIDIPQKIKDDLFRIQNIISGNLAKINWVAKKNLHITLKFIGDIDEIKLKEIKEKLKEIKFNSFDLELDKLGFYLFKGTPRIIRLSFLDGDKLIELQRKIDEELLGICDGDQKFSPHLTLGRVKMIKKKKEFKDKINEFEFTKEKFNVDNFQLVESKLTKNGPKYKIIEEFKA
jgi:2'-5' RNA ligase